MTITDHAIRRYKQRVGKRTAARKRIIARIHQDLKNDVWFRKACNKEDVYGAYILVTSKYQAVCIKNYVITIEELTPAMKKEIEELKLAQEQQRREG
ncbi:MAG: hypothetical protein ACI35R_11180 [Bacillus sp. (in: firmicutes)]